MTILLQRSGISAHHKTSSHTAFGQKRSQKLTGSKNFTNSIKICIKTLAVISFPAAIAIADPVQAKSSSLPNLSPTLASPVLAQLSAEQADLQYKTAAVVFNQGNLARTVSLLEPALETYLANQNKRQIQQTASFLGVVYGMQGDAAIAQNDLPTALENYQRKVEVLALGFNRIAEAQALIQTGQIALLLEQTLLAENYLMAGLEIAEAVEYQPLIDQAQALLAN